MPRQVKVATIQLDGTSQPRDERLALAATHIAQAAAKGAKLIVLPSQFNTGKTFLETTYERTERLNDPTMIWLHQQAEQHDVYLAASWLVVDQDDTYNAAFLVDPSGNTWRYDQRYPLMWERVFYRDGHGITVADTEIGRIGLMIGHDAAHPDIWERYAAKIDLLLVLHAQIDYSQAYLQLPGTKVGKKDQFGLPAKWLLDHTKQFLQQDIPLQANWLNVPVVVVGCTGYFNSILPAPYFSVQALLSGRPSFLQHSELEGQYAAVQLIAPFVRYTGMYDQNGNALASADDTGDAVVIAEIAIHDGDFAPLPLDEPQPTVSTPEWTRLLLDSIASGLMTLIYRRGVRRQWGARSAPMDTSTRTWLRILALVTVITAILGRFLLPKKR